MKAPTHFEERLERDIALIRSKVVEMSALAERALLDSLKAFTEANLTLAYSVILRDKHIDEKDKELDRLCLEFLVRQQPVAGHLRFVYSTIKINLELERIGDYAESIARQVLKLAPMPAVQTEHFTNLAKVAVQMLHSAIQAFVEQNTELARATIAIEDETDQLRRAIDAEVTQLQQQGKIPLTALTPLLTISRRFERVADQAKAICEETLYICTGQYMKHQGSEVFRVLFVDEHNSCRSQMAEAIGNSLELPQFVFSSAGLTANVIDWRTIEFLGEKDLDISHQHPKSLGQIPNLDHYHVIIALAKEARKAFPPPPTKTVGLDWNVEDPSTQPGSLADVREAYENTFQYINTHVRELVQALVGDTQQEER